MPLQIKPFRNGRAATSSIFAKWALSFEDSRGPSPPIFHVRLGLELIAIATFFLSFGALFRLDPRLQEPRPRVFDLIAR